MPKMILYPKKVMALGGYIRETAFPYKDVEPFPYRNVIVANPLDEPIKIDVPAYDKDWVERHRKLGLIVVPVTEKDDFISLFLMVKEKIKKSEKS
ncbi:Energy-converting hydrogenase B subunit P [Methanocaldococcus villosus KIN24-T80]|uniref:Energy-converting hydrogenase B subunit P n=1 Tax=Methanocaldococcus villosus KIN24-T80 TaxID=1069083 RepID=N6VQC9_9EURY|nr:energy-converting hydrogenase B subunit EhbP [Methanocaldococcus villosus]ENN96070.1 Energy-converting hydrogenase B subunit P [Methanocaldococcus villosus KIN24-T80]